MAALPRQKPQRGRIGTSLHSRSHFYVEQLESRAMLSVLRFAPGSTLAEATATASQAGVSPVVKSETWTTTGDKNIEAATADARASVVFSSFQDSPDPYSNVIGYSSVGFSSYDADPTKGANATIHFHSGGVANNAIRVCINPTGDEKFGDSVAVAIDYHGSAGVSASYRSFNANWVTMVDAVPMVFRATVGEDFEFRVNANDNFDFSLAMTSNTIPSVSVDEDRVTPAKATDLNLKVIFGTEEIHLPVTFTNVTQLPIVGNIQIEFFLSRDKTKTPSSMPFASKNRTVELSGFGKVEIDDIDLRIPSAIWFSPRVGTPLHPGEKYYIVAKATLLTVASPIAIQGLNSLVGLSTGYVSSEPLKFLGTPQSNPGVFANGLF